MYLMVEFPRIKTNDKEYSIVYYEKVIHKQNICFYSLRFISQAADRSFSFDLHQDGDDASPVLTSCEIVKVPDPQMGMVRQKHTLFFTSYPLHCV